MAYTHIILDGGDMKTCTRALAADLMSFMSELPDELHRGPEPMASESQIHI